MTRRQLRAMAQYHRAKTKKQREHFRAIVEGPSSSLNPAMTILDQLAETFIPAWAE